MTRNRAEESEGGKKGPNTRPAFLSRLNGRTANCPQFILFIFHLRLQGPLLGYPAKRDCFLQ